MGKILTKDFITDDKTNKVFISSLIDTKTGDLDKEARANVKSCIMQFEKDCELLYNTKDVWARDYMPIQLTKNTYLGYTYKPDYLTSLLRMQSVLQTGNFIMSMQRSMISMVLRLSRYLSFLMVVM